MIINSSKQSLNYLFFRIEEIFNVKWILDYLKYEYIYWLNWAPLILTVIWTTFYQFRKFFKNSQKKSGLHKRQGVIGLDVFKLETKFSLHTPLMPVSI